MAVDRRFLGAVGSAGVDIRVGNGYDIHRFADGRKLILAGVYFEAEPGLIGHSDADVVAHAAIDALLGAAGLGDIGTHFPPGDPRFAGADSMALLRQVVELLAQHGWRPANLDATVIAEQPRLAPYVPAMRANLAGAAGLPVEAVSVKAKTNEGLGALGAGAGIAAMAVALIERRRSQAEQL
jgi:2-C-methyl-D-erythritol 4-phosphate cytidylyltransferase/2-C-methyl-D-erythritol 2,4-cyclodiphosphate synthase